MLIKLTNTPVNQNLISSNDKNINNYIYNFKNLYFVLSVNRLFDRIPLHIILSLAYMPRKINHIVALEVFQAGKSFVNLLLNESFLLIQRNQLSTEKV